MFAFEEAILWRAAFETRKDRYSKARDMLRQNYLDLRSRVALMVTSIDKYVPGLTIHDITHLDSLWEIAGTIAGKQYRLNPAEAYVFGAAILLHDAAMTILAYPGGLSEIQKTNQWRDTITAALRGQSDNPISEEQIANPPEALRDAAISEVLRSLHAKRAKDLPFGKWPSPEGGTPEFLIQESTLRNYFGNIIGRIAYSHHVPVSQLEQLLGKPISAPTFAPAEWVVDPIKIGCLLRCADAAHIDERRAPRFLYALTNPQGISADHWKFQSKIGKPQLEGDALIFSSGPEFTLQDADAWWLCFDTIRMIDGELHDTDLLLEELGRCKRFAARRVKGAETPHSLADFIRTQGWEPIDTHPQVSDVPGLVRLLGGAHLYGNDKSVPVRELVQNASDAIRARRLMENRPNEYGCIRVGMHSQSDGTWLTVEDDGVGMSARTMSGPLLDFGKSFWMGDAVRHEFPGLIAKGMTATGRFGIGFFSVFMLGDIVRVTSRRYDAALESTNVLEFRTGLQSRPILRRANPEECLQDGGTRVSVRLKDDPRKDGGLLIRPVHWQKKELTLSWVVGSICPNIDANLVVEEQDRSIPCITANDWLPMEGSSLFNRLIPIEDEKEKSLLTYSKNLRPLVDDSGSIYGRATILGFDNYYWDHYGCVTVGGFVAAHLAGIGGILVGSAQTIARNAAVPTVPPTVLAAWATDQAHRIAESALSTKEKHRAAGVVMQCGGDASGLPFVSRNGKYLDREEFEKALCEKEEIITFDGDEVSFDEYTDHCVPKDFRDHFEPLEDLFFVSNQKIPILTVGNQSWPMMILGSDASEQCPRTYSELLKSTIRAVWGDFEEWSDNQIVGSVNGEFGEAEIEREVTVFRRISQD